MDGGYNALSLLVQSWRGHRGWPLAWRKPEPQPGYQVVIVGGGGHGLATAYYLAKEHGITRVAVLERGWIGGGNTGRNTAIVRSNYKLAANARFLQHALRLWQGLSRDLDFNVMFSPRGVLYLAHDPATLTALAWRGNAMRYNGVDGDLLDRAALRRLLPAMDWRREAAFPVLGGLIQRQAGTARHDAVAWGYARAASALGVDIIENCEVTGIRRDGARVVAVDTSRGVIRTGKIGLCVSGRSSQLAAMAGLSLPLETHALQALVTESVKPVLDTVVISNAARVYLSQSDKGELVIGGDLDMANSYAQRGSPLGIAQTLAGAEALFPGLGRLRVMRVWGGTADMTMDGAPIIGKTPVDGLYLNGGWCYGGFKATPASGWVFAHTIAEDRPHPLNEPFALDRFARGETLDEGGTGPYPWLH